VDPDQKPKKEIVTSTNAKPEPPNQTRQIIMQGGNPNQKLKTRNPNQKPKPDTQTRNPNQKSKPGTRT
jgi:hypothetical protein